MRETKIVKRFLSGTDIKAGYKPKFHEFSDYIGYRRDKRRIEALPLTAEEHELAAKTAARRRGI